VPPRPVVPEQLRGKVFRGTTAVRTGLLTPNQLRGPAWRRLFPDVYVDRDVPVTHALRARAACGLAVPGSVITGASAAALWGVDLVSPEDEVELTVPPGRHAVRATGLRVRRCHVADEHVLVRRRIRVTSPEATAVRLAGHLPLEDAVVAVDRLIAARGLDLQKIRALAGVAVGAGSARARTACALADGLAESPQETRLRLLIGRSRLPQPVAQYRVRHGGRVVARVDFAWPDRKVALEYDGLWHAEDGQFASDRARLNRLREAGWTVVFVTAADMYQPAKLVARIAAALA
jgi:very-short-patch-repair endonuclease